jgi:hypothetical protein
VTLFDSSDNALLGTLGNGASNHLLDTPQYLPGALNLNRTGRNGRPAFETSRVPEEELGDLGNAKRRSFYGPGIDNFDVAIQKSINIKQDISLKLRVEAFNAFNHAQFYGPASVNGQRGDPNFGSIQHSAAPRLLQLVAKLAFKGNCDRLTALVSAASRSCHSAIKSPTRKQNLAARLDSPAHLHLPR